MDRHTSTILALFALAGTLVGCGQRPTSIPPQGGNYWCCNCSCQEWFDEQDYLAQDPSTAMPVDPRLLFFNELLPDRETCGFGHGGECGPGKCDDGEPDTIVEQCLNDQDGCRTNLPFQDADGNPRYIVCTADPSNQCVGDCPDDVTAPSTAPLGSTSSLVTAWTIDADASDAVIRSGNKSARASVSGRLVTTPPCDDCGAEVVTMNFVIDDFSLRGYSFSRVWLHLVAPVFADQVSDDAVQIGAGHAALSVSFRADGHHGSDTVVINERMPIFFAPSRDRLSFDGTINLPDDVSVEFSVAADRVNRGAPVARATVDAVVECQSARGAPVALDGRGSFSPDGLPLRMMWVENLRNSDPSIQATVLGNGASVQPELQLGEHQISLVVTDAFGEEDVFTFTVEVVDTTPPEIIGVAAVPDCLWPPNGKFAVYHVGSELTATAVDRCGAATEVRIARVAVESDANAGLGEWVNAGDAVCLRSRRSGTASNGRTYELQIESYDEAGNRTEASVAVRVPHHGGCEAPRAELLGECPLPAPSGESLLSN